MEKFMEVILENKICFFFFSIATFYIVFRVSFYFFKTTKNKSVKIEQKNNIVNGDMAGRDIRK